MSTLFGSGRRLRQAIVPLLWACAAAYFGYHAVQGERGLVAWLRLSQEVERIEASLQIAVAERASLEHNVALLSPDGLDLDMLEERARVVLGLAHPQDFIVLSE